MRALEPSVPFELPAACREMLQRARAFAAAHPAAHGRQSGLDRAGWSAAAEFGAFRLAARRDADGDRGALATFALLEGMGRGGADRGLLFAMGAHLFGCFAPLALYGTPSQARQWDEKLRNGSVVGALAVTERGGGSSLDHIETSATKTADGYLIDGRKTLIANAPEAGLFVVLARQFPERGPLGLTAFAVPRASEGLAVAPIATVGLPGLPMGDVILERCLVPSGAVLGSPGAGLRVFSTAMQWERACLLAGFLGAAERDLAACVGALRARGDRAGALLNHQAVSHRLARTRLGLEAARLLAYRAAAGLDAGREDQALAAMAKVAMSEAVVAAAEDGLKLVAGRAWRGEPVDLAAALVDTIGGISASGTTEVQLELLARLLQAEHP